MENTPEKPLDEMDDWELVALYRENNAAAFETFVFRYRKYLASVIVKNYKWLIVGDRTIIDDILQETWIRVWKKIRDGEYSTDKIFISWVIGILKNIPWLKDIKRIPTSQVMNEENDCNIVEDLKSTEPSPDKLAADAEFHEHLEECISSQSEKLRKAVRMKYYLGMTNKEIAKKMGYSGVWIGKMLKKGYAHLTKCMKTKGHDISK